MNLSKRDAAFFNYAMPRSLHVLIRNAAVRGRGWYQYSHHDLIISIAVTA